MLFVDEHLSRDGVPLINRSITTSRCHRVAIGGKGNSMNACPVLRKGANLLAGCQVPKAHSVVKSPGGEKRTIRRKGDRGLRAGCLARRLNEKSNTCENVVG